MGNRITLRLIFLPLLLVVLLFLFGCAGKREFLKKTEPENKGKFDELRRKDEITLAKEDITFYIPEALDRYRLDNGFYPTMVEGLDALINEPPTATNWKGPYLLSYPRDPWGRDYRYIYPGKHGFEYDLYSLGPDGVESEDDIK
jgi:type II secretion system protein G